MTDVDPDYGPEPEWMATDCPGGLAWDCCHADDCGVRDDGTGCQLALPVP